MSPSEAPGPKHADAYVAADLQDRLATDPRVAAPGLRVSVVDGRGQVSRRVSGQRPGDDCRDAVERVIAELMPDTPIEVLVECVPLAAADPDHTELMT